MQKLDFKIDKIDFDDIYNGFKVSNRHNLILSIEDGLFHYEFDFRNLSEKEKSLHKNINPKMTMWIEYPNFLLVKCHDYYSAKEKETPLQHIRDFIASLHHGIHSATVLDVDIRQYYSEVNNDLFKE